MATTRRGVLLLALLGLLLSEAPGAAAAPRASHGTLTGDTTVTWRGATGIRLRTNGPASMPVDAIPLHVKGGTYAFVMILPDPQPPECREQTPFPHCYGWLLTYFPGVEEFTFETRPGYERQASAVRPPMVIGRYLDVYLFTDGEASIRLRPRGYRGRSSFVAAGRIRGRAMRLPGSCDTICGDRGMSTVAAGGAAYDYGDRPGHLIRIAYSITRQHPDPQVPDNHVNVMRGCNYPSLEHPRGSPDPADHPYGCELPTDRQAHPTGWAGEVVSSPSFGTGQFQIGRFGDQTGKRYVGFSAGNAWPQDRIAAGYAVWFSYGIT